MSIGRLTRQAIRAMRSSTQPKRGPDGRPSLQPRTPGEGPHRLPRKPGVRGPFQPGNIPKPQFNEFPNTPWWEPLLAAVTVETAVVGAFLAPIGAVVDRYLDQKDRIDSHPLFTPCGSEPHLRESELTRERHLSDMERLRRYLRWYSEADQMTGKVLGRDIDKLKTLIADMDRRRQLNELQTRLNGLTPNSPEAQRLRQQVHHLTSTLGTATPAPSGIGAKASADASASASAARAVQAAPVRLKAGDWDPSNRERLEGLLASDGIGSPTYDPAHPPYVVFDFDNTTIFLDIEEAAFAFQLINLRFNMTPEQLNRAIRTGVPKSNFRPEYNNAVGRALSIDKIAPDIVASYTWLYQHYSGFGAGGDQSLESVRNDPHYLDFTTKLRYLYDAIGGTFDHSVSYPWITYLFAGMTEAQVRQLTVEAIQWQRGQPIEKVKWTSPTTLSGRAGVVSVTWRNGLRTIPEMQDLYRAFRDAGFHVWVCSASFVDVIREFSSNSLFGYGNDPDRVLAMELERDANGVIQPEYRHGFEQTQGPGKTAAIRRRLLGLYDGRGPVFVAGDSEGDQYMMEDFPGDLKLTLIVNRLRDPATPIGKLSQQAVTQHGHPNATVLLQGRNEKTGRLLPEQGSILLGKETSQVLPDAPRGAMSPAPPAPYPKVAVLPRGTPRMAPALASATPRPTRDPIDVPLATPASDKVQPIERVLRHLGKLCPIDAQQRIDVSVLMIGDRPDVVLRFSDGNELTLSELLSQHEAAKTAAQSRQGKPRFPFHGEPASRARLVDVLGYVMKRPDLHAMQVVSVTALQSAKEVLRQVILQLEQTKGKLSVDDVPVIMVQFPDGRREKLMTLMSDYWAELRQAFAAAGPMLPADRDYHLTEDALDIMYYQATGQPRIRRRLAGEQVAIDLKLDPKSPLPNASTLQGALAILYAYSKTDRMASAEAFPQPSKDGIVILYDGRTGRTFNYKNVMIDVQRWISAEKGDAAFAARWRNVDVSTPGLLLDFVRRNRGQLPGSQSTVVRRRGDSTQRLVASLPSSPAVTQPSVVMGQRTPTPAYKTGDEAYQTPEALQKLLVARLSHATGMADAARICWDMARRGQPDAEPIAIWLDKVGRNPDIGLDRMLDVLPLADALRPIVLPIVMNDVAMRALSVATVNEYVRQRWEKVLTDLGSVSDPFRRFNRIREFVVTEEARLDAAPTATRTSEGKAPAAAPWEGMEVPQAFVDAMRDLLGARDVQLRVRDVARAFMALMPLDDEPFIQGGQRHAPTWDVAYNTLTGRKDDGDAPVLSPADLIVQQQMRLVGDVFGMVVYGDYWLARGMKIANRDNIIPPTLRFYFAVNPEHAVPVLQGLNTMFSAWTATHLHGRPRDLQLKITQIPGELLRVDAALVYTDAANQGIVRDIIRFKQAHPGYMRNVKGPPGAANILNADGTPSGISVAEAPPHVRDSRNGVMGRIMTEAMRAYRMRIAQGRPFAQRELLQVAAYYMQRNGIDVERPASYAGTDQREPGWKIFEEVFRLTDQSR